MGLFPPIPGDSEGDLPAIDPAVTAAMIADLERDLRIAADPSDGMFRHGDYPTMPPDPVEVSPPVDYERLARIKRAAERVDRRHVPYAPVARPAAPSRPDPPVGHDRAPGLARRALRAVQRLYRAVR